MIAAPAEEQVFNAREPAWRVFAAEFNEARHEMTGTGERAPSYVVTPLGARMNRVLIVGVLTSNEVMGDDGNMRRAQITDPTGVFHVYAGQYQPGALQALAEIEAPAIVAVVGKARTYSPQEGVVYTSIRPETVQQVTSADRDAWILETAQHTLGRIEALGTARTLEDPSEERLAGLALPRRLVPGVQEALKAYPHTDLGHYVTLVGDALSYLLPAPPAPRIVRKEAPASGAPTAPMAAALAANPAAPTPQGTSPVPASPPVVGGAPAGPPAASAAKPDSATFLIELIEKLDKGDGAPWDDLVKTGAKAGLSEEEVEEAMNLLMDQGRVFEPVLGRLKAT